MHQHSKKHSCTFVHTKGLWPEMLTSGSDLCEGVREILGGQGRDRTVDLPIFSRTLVPTELPGRDAKGYQDPCGAFGEDLRFLDWSGA